MGTGSDDRLISQNLPCLLDLHVPLSHVHAVCTEDFCRFCVIVDNAGNSRITAQLQNGICQFNSPFGGTVFFPNLKHGNAAGNGTLYLFRQICRREFFEFSCNKGIDHWVLLH